jgi:hypothetical protein
MKGHTMAARRFAFGLVVGGLAAVVSGQATVDVGETPSGGGSPAVVKIPNPDDPAVKQYAATQKQRVQAEKEMRKIRVEFFDNIRNTEIRQIGISKLRQYADKPYLYPSLLREFARSGEDVRGGILDMLVAQETDEADTTIAWTAVFDKDPALRKLAAARLRTRIGDGAEATPRIKQVITLGLKPGATEEEIKTAAELANQFNVLEAVPLLINAQVTGAQTGLGGGGGDTSLAYILVGTQQAYVADLEPVVGDSAVAFDPTIAVVTEGTYLRIIDAHVITYRMEVHNALIDMSSRAMGKPTDGFGFDQPRWRTWYTDEFKPFMEARKADEARKAKG